MKDNGGMEYYSAERALAVAKEYHKINHHKEFLDILSHIETASSQGNVEILIKHYMINNVMMDEFLSLGYAIDNGSRIIPSFDSYIIEPVFRQNEDKKYDIIDFQRVECNSKDVDDAIFGDNPSFVIISWGRIGYDMGHYKPKPTPPPSRIIKEGELPPKPKSKKNI